VASGAIKVALADVRDGPQLIETAEFLMGDDCGEARLLKIPPGVAHGCKALTDANLLYFTSHTYDPEDELRLPHDDARIGYDWLRREIR
jgi:dTDP-4-dehydrorhamnose 3,5-epimerase